MSPQPGASASASVPLLLRVLLLYVEPLFALGGVGLALFKPEDYVKSMTKAAVTVVQPGSRFIYTELAGGWLHFAYTEAVVLRLVDDVRIWRLLCAGMLLSDLAYTHSCAEAIGGWSVWLRIWEWTKDDWTITVTTWPFLLARLAIVSGTGLKSRESSSKKQKA